MAEANKKEFVKQLQKKGGVILFKGTRTVEKNEIVTFTGKEWNSLPKNIKSLFGAPKKAKKD